MFDVKGIDPAIKSLNVFKKFFLEYDFLNYTHSFTKIKAKIGGQYASFSTTVYLTWPFCPESALTHIEINYFFLCFLLLEWTMTHYEFVWKSELKVFEV